MTQVKKEATDTYKMSTETETDEFAASLTFGVNEALR